MESRSPPTNPSKFTPLPHSTPDDKAKPTTTEEITDLDTQSESEIGLEEQDRFLQKRVSSKQRRNRKRKQRFWHISARACTLLNVCVLGFLLGVSWVGWDHARSKGSGGDCELEFGQQASPLFEDGVVRYTNRRVHPMKIFQSEPSDEVDRAWNETLEPNEGMIHIHKSRAASLSRSVESWVDQDMVVYGVAAYHQLHCLDRIRQSFHPERYFPDEDEAMVIFHRNHCFDLLRQTLLCTADVSLVPWWNATYTYTDAQGQEHFSDAYLAMDPKQRAKNSYVVWDEEMRCRDWERVRAWVEENVFA